MVYKLGSVVDMSGLPAISNDLYGILKRYVCALDHHYGTSRDIDHDDGGYILYVEPGTSLLDIQKIIDYTKYPVEYVTLHHHTNPLFCSAHYILHNEYTVTVVMAVEDIPAKWLDELEGEWII